MANYYAAARSNYFAVIDENAFRKWAGNIDLSILEPDHHIKVADGRHRFGITPGDNSDSGGWPTSLYHEETGEYEDINLPEQLAVHLAHDEVAVLMEVGNEKLRYVSGVAVAVNHKGDIARLDLESIYKKATRLGNKVTRAEY